jgi:hypothetical protein
VFTRTSSHLRRILETLGIERKQRDVTTPLSTALAAARQRPDDAWEPAGSGDQPEAEKHASESPNGNAGPSSCDSGVLDPRGVI